VTSTVDVDRLEQAVTRALTTFDPDVLHIVGYGEISCVVAWPDAGGPWACKRLPVFSSAARFDAYRAVFDDYLEALTGRGVTVVDSRLEPVGTTDGQVVAYCVQPMLDSDTLAPALLARADPAEGRRLLDTIIGCLADVVDPQLGIDGQLSNWAVDGSGVVYFDITTPLLRDEQGRERLDTELFLASLPAALRLAVRRFLLDGIFAPYYSPRRAALDLLGNLHKEGLGEWVAPGVELANERLDAGFTVSEVQRYYRRDARLWSMLQQLRRLDRQWQRHVRRRPYPFLLPGSIDRHV
jgi:hypothetical protein